VFSTGAIFSNIFDLWLVKSTDTELTDMEGQVYYLMQEMNNSFKYYYKIVGRWWYWGVELRAPNLLSRCSVTWTMPPTLFDLISFRTESHIFAWGWP
jgi:hypothetical protein